MNILNELKSFDEDYNLWYDKSEEASESFLKSLVADAKENMQQYENHCLRITEENDTSIGVIYEAFSNFSEDHFEFLQKEIERKTRQLQNGELDADLFDSLEFDYAPMSEKAPHIYLDCVDFLTRNLSPNQTVPVNLAILNLLSWVSIDLDLDNNKKEIKRIQDRLMNDYHTYPLKVRKEMTEYFSDILEWKDAPKISFVEKLKIIILGVMGN